MAITIKMYIKQKRIRNIHSPRAQIYALMDIMLINQISILQLMQMLNCAQTFYKIVHDRISLWYLFMWRCMKEGIALDKKKVYYKQY